MNSINLNILEKDDQHHLIDEDTLKINQRISEVFKNNIENVLLIQPPHFPEEMLDVFRTLLNFETDDYKLLQLIMFGQPEMGNVIHKYPNFLSFSK